MSFSENLQFLRSRDQITQEQLAEQLGVSRQSVSKWESGTSFPEMETLLSICDLYNVNLDTLLRGSVEESLLMDTAHYDSFMTRYAKRMACSIGGIIAAVAIMILFTAIGIHELLSVSFLLLVIAVSTVTMVASGIQKDHFHKRHPVLSDFYTEEEKEAFHQKLVWLISGGVGAILFGVVLMVAAFYFLPEQEPYESIVSSLFLLIIAGAVSTFVYAGIMDEKYKIWKYNRDNNPTPEAKKRLNAIGTICVCIMLAATAVFLAIGFSSDDWSKFWLFPVGGILCAIVSVVLDPYKGEDD